MEAFEIIREDDGSGKAVNDGLVLALVLLEAAINHRAMGKDGSESFVVGDKGDGGEERFEATDKGTNVLHRLRIGTRELLGVTDDDLIDLLAGEIVAKPIDEGVCRDRSEWPCSDLQGVGNGNAATFTSVVDR